MQYLFSSNPKCVTVPVYSQAPIPIDTRGGSRRDGARTDSFVQTIHPRWTPRFRLPFALLLRMDNQQLIEDSSVTPPSERTPLLLGSSNRRSQHVHWREATSVSDSEDLPHIGPFVARMRTEDLHKYTLDELCPDTLHSRAQRTAFAICALLYFRAYLKGSTPRGRDIWVQWSQEQEGAVAARDVDALVQRVWAHFVSEEGSPAEVEGVLWTEYPLYPDSRHYVRGKSF